MKQIRFKHLVTLGLCCSLLVNSITGITAIAETVTIESSPTVESSMKEETTKASTEESIKESTEKSTKESVEGSTVKSTAESMQESEESEQEEITKETTEERKQTEESSVVSPKQIQPIISNEDYYTAIQTELTNFVGRAQIYQDWSSTLPAGRMTFDITTPDAPSLNMTDFNLSADLKSLTRREYNSNLVDITSSKLSIAKTQNSLAIVVPEQTSSLPTTPARAYMNYLANIHLTVPKYVQSTSISGNVVSLVVNGRVGAANGPIENPRSQIVLSKLTTSSFEIHTDNDLLTNYYDTTNTSIGTVPGTFIWSVNRYGNANLENTVFMPKQASVITVALKKVTENFKDVNGTAIPAPTGFTQGKKTSITNNNYTFKQSGTLPETYKASNGKNYKFKGWYKGKTKPNTLTTSTTPTYNTTFDDNDDMTAVYKEASISANLTMRGAVDVIDNGGTMEYWEVLLKNTGEAPLTSIKIKPTTDWAAGISTPTELFILGTGQNTKVRPITKEQWKAGFEIPLDKSLPVGGQLTINLIGTKVTGQPNQVLKAAVEVSGNFNKLTASDTVRIKDLDQETKEPTGEGFISVPTFDFGQVGVASVTKQHGLKKAADYYGNGTRNPYVRISKTQPNWSLTAQLSQPKSATDSLPTATRLILGQVPIYSVGNYNLPTELMTSVGVTRSLGLTADNSSVSIIGNQEFSGADVYQLDFQFDKVKLEVPANQGVKGQQYQAAVTWNLVTGP
ncbi:WxL domain-containing protein [Enterococcus faecalis]|nr:WxL domain-containing protein [Enterococcus faecalis]EGO8760716.1 WxL domain-containing protein [Enterococcus faecalis]EGO8910045.1 WxL domain-containing protein [Enterococcus faecalis]EHE8481831.1 WxL domain-containing protein [Enterococcus faecalis]EIR3705022.1 WxL domain-containing protein [Enterococcus faecalis]EJB5571516.1 WxL domain-containing protein [Enterococcus faecalis]